MNNNVLVTGGAGYIGSHACKALRRAGFNPITFDNLITGWKEAVKHAPFEKGDLLNKAEIDGIFVISYRSYALCCVKPGRREYAKAWSLLGK